MLGQYCQGFIIQQVRQVQRLMLMRNVFQISIRVKPLSLLRFRPIFSFRVIVEVGFWQFRSKLVSRVSSAFIRAPAFIIQAAFLSRTLFIVRPGQRSQCKVTKMLANVILEVGRTLRAERTIVKGWVLRMRAALRNQRQLVVPEFSWVFSLHMFDEFLFSFEHNRRCMGLGYTMPSHQMACPHMG